MTESLWHPTIFCFWEESRINNNQHVNPWVGGRGERELGACVCLDGGGGGPDRAKERYVCVISGRR